MVAFTRFLDEAGRLGHGAVGLTVLVESPRSVCDGVWRFPERLSVRAASLTKPRPMIQRFLGAARLALVGCFLGACSHLVERSNAGIASLEEDPGALGAISRSAKYSGWA